MASIQTRKRDNTLEQIRNKPDIFITAFEVRNNLTISYYSFRLRLAEN